MRFVRTHAPFELVRNGNVRVLSRISTNQVNKNTLYTCRHALLCTSFIWLYRQAYCSHGKKRNINRLKNSLEKIKWICCSANTHHTGYICVCLLERKTVAQCCHILFILSINAHRCWKMWRIYPLNIPIIVFVLSLFLSTSRSRLALTLSHYLSLSFRVLALLCLSVCLHDNNAYNLVCAADTQL